MLRSSARVRSQLFEFSNHTLVTVEDLSNLLEVVGGFLVESCSFIARDGPVLELVEDVFDAVHPLPDVWIAGHGQITPSQSAVMASNSSSKMAIATL